MREQVGQGHSLTTGPKLRAFSALVMLRGPCLVSKMPWRAARVG